MVIAQGIDRHLSGWFAFEGRSGIEEYRETLAAGAGIVAVIAILLAAVTSGFEKNGQDAGADLLRIGGFLAVAGLWFAVWLPLTVRRMRDATGLEMESFTLALIATFLVVFGVGLLMMAALAFAPPRPTFHGAEAAAPVPAAEPAARMAPAAPRGRKVKGRAHA